jgi:hypothetical protein
MPEKKWIFDTVALSNFLLSDSIFILENRYHRQSLITRQFYKILSKMTDAGFYSPLRSIADII